MIEEHFFPTCSILLSSHNFFALEMQWGPTKHNHMISRWYRHSPRKSREKVLVSTLGKSEKASPQLLQIFPQIDFSTKILISKIWFSRIQFFSTKFLLNSIKFDQIWLNSCRKINFVNPGIDNFLQRILKISCRESGKPQFFKNFFPFFLQTSS